MSAIQKSETAFAHIDLVLTKAAHLLSQVSFTPSNLESERQKFFSNESYNPKFTYPETTINIPQIVQKLESLDIPQTTLGIIFRNKRQELLTIASLCKARGSTSLTNASVALYGIPTLPLVKRAQEIIHMDDSPDTVFYSSQQLVIHLTNAMHKFGFNWSVKEKPMAAKSCVNIEKKTLYIRENTFFTQRFLKRLIVHEIGAHILRYENGSQQPYKIFTTGFSDYLTTEEGLAAVSEEMNNCMNISTMRTYAARTMAVHKALSCSFKDTFKYLEPFVGKENAFELTVRAKRGMSDTFFAGAFTKDHVYLKGYYLVKRFLANGGNMQELYYGKIGVNDIKVMHEIEGVQHPLFLSNVRHYAAQRISE